MDDHRRSTLNGFVVHSFERLSGKRRDEKWIQDCLMSPSSSFIPVWQSKNLFNEAQVPHPVALSSRQIQPLREAAESVVFLGMEAGNACFALGLPGEDASIQAILVEFGRFQDLKRMGPLLDHGEGALLAYARAMVHWHRRNRFCGDCGSSTKSVEGGHKRVCVNPQCLQQHFPRTDPAIIVLVTQGDNCLLGRQPIWAKGFYSTIAGFVEPGESLEHAVIREVFEETSVQISRVHYHSSQPWPFPGSIMLGFTAEAGSQSIHLGDNELEDARWFSREELAAALIGGILQLPSSFSIAYRLIEDWFESSGSERLRRVAGL